MINVTIKGKNIDAKFGFGALYKANQKFSNHADNGGSLENGAANIFLSLLTGDPGALMKVIQVIIPSEYKEDDYIEAIEELTEGGDKLDEVVTMLKDEMVQSGFFKKAINNQIEAFEENLPMLKANEKMEDQAKSVEAALKLMKENI
ncbi:tail assembly chaperone [Weissella oryzae]|nr:tail assembly chaperone [Weissella oryzae]